jgi:cell division FtsZ-interacting protein ZapD
MTQQYEIRIRGRVRPQLLEDFDGLEQSVEKVETVLHGPVVDQAALHGLLQRIEALGLELVEVRRLPSGG